MGKEILMFGNWKSQFDHYKGPAPLRDVDIEKVFYQTRFLLRKRQ